MPVIRVASLFGRDARTGLVEMTLPKGAVIQLTPDEARDLALNLVAGAEAAEQDQFVYEFASDAGRGAADARQGIAMLSAFRQWKAKVGWAAYRLQPVRSKEDSKEAEGDRDQKEGN